MICGYKVVRERNMILEQEVTDRDKTKRVWKMYIYYTYTRFSRKENHTFTNPILQHVEHKILYARRK